MFEDFFGQFDLALGRCAKRQAVASGALHALSSSFVPAAHVVDVAHASRLRALRRTLVAFATQVVADVHNKRGSARAPPFAAVNLDARVDTALSGTGILERATPRTLWLGLRLN